MAKYSTHVTEKETPQSQPIPFSNQVKNNAGGYVFEVDKWTQLRRFLILGNEGGSYYQNEQKMTLANATAALACIKEDGSRVVDEVVAVSDQGLAPKNDPAIFILALASVKGDLETKWKAYIALPKVCRIGTHLFTFCAMRDELGGWGDGMKRAVSRWYTEKTVDQVAYQMAKYQQRNGWSHRDVLRLAHPKSETHNDLFKWAVGKGNSKHELINAMEQLHSETTQPERVAQAVYDQGLTREMIPTKFLNEPAVQWALMQKQPLMALIRNLGNYSKSGLLKPLSEASKFVKQRLTAEAIHKARVHPFSILLALKTYALGHGLRGSGEWTVDPGTVDALDHAFYEAFKNVEPTGKNYLQGVDVSGSMGWGHGSSVLTSREAAMAMAMIINKTEDNVYTHGFSGRFMDLAISKHRRLDDACKAVAQLPFERTDCAVPMTYARKNNIEVDTFIVYTDNETWAGQVHPKQALDQYRQAMGRDARLIVCAFEATKFSIADPNDAGMMDIAGLDASLPQLISNFAVGNI